MAVAAAIAVAGLVLSAVGTFQSAKAQKKAAKKQDKLNALQAQRERRQSIREARIQRAQVLNSGVQVGAGDSSSVAGGISSVASQLGSNLGFSNQTEKLGKAINKDLRSASNFSALAGFGGALTSFGFGAGAFQPKANPGPAPNRPPIGVNAGTSQGPVAGRPF